MTPEELEAIRERAAIRVRAHAQGIVRTMDYYAQAADDRAALLEEVDRLRDFIDSLTNDPVHGLSAKLVLRVLRRKG